MYRLSFLKTLAPCARQREVSSSSHHPCIITDSSESAINCWSGFPRCSWRSLPQFKFSMGVRSLCAQDADG